MKEANHIYPEPTGEGVTMEISDTADVYKSLYSELEDYEKRGISMSVDGSPASPLQIVQAHMIHEQGSYMRDYILDPQGYIESLAFVGLNKEYNYNDKKREI